ncbi:MAG TPA: AAA family ATPase [Bryobacteraceae bacterium]
MTPQLSDVLEFGAYRIDREQRLLTKENHVIPLAPKVFDTLLVLAESGGRMLEKETLLKKIWPDAFVEEGSLTRNISTLRKTLGEGPQDQKYIVTVARRGYRFVAKVSAPAVPDRPGGREDPAHLPHGKNDIPSREPAITFPGRADISPGEVAFVGRERELHRLSGHFQRMLGGAGKIVFLTGEAGIGKSALAEEFIRSVQRIHPGLMLACGRAVEQYGTGEAYLPFLDALFALLCEGGDTFRTTLRALAPLWCLQLPFFNSSDDLDQLRRETAGATKERMLREMGDALGALSSIAPLLLLLEDLHWADRPTIDLLRRLGQQITGQRILLVVTLRPEDAEIVNHPLRNCRIEMQAHQQCDEIALGLLNPEDIGNLLHLRFSPNDFPGDLAGWVRRRTDGQPLFTVSLLEFLASRGTIANVNGCWILTSEMTLEIPDSVRAMIRKKIEALDARSRLTLQYASVEGEEFLSTVVAGLLGEDQLEVEEHLAVLANTHRLIEIRGEDELPDGALATRYAFAHALYQNVFYDELVSQRRALLHNRAGEQLLKHYRDRAPRIAVQLAMHFERGRNWARAIEFLLLAGTNATSVYANIQAEMHYTRALELAPRLAPEARPETEFRIYEKRAAVYLTTHSVVPATGMPTSRFDLSIADCKEMIVRARAAGSPALECLALYTLGNTFFYANRIPEMWSALQEMLKLAERTQSDVARLQTVALMAQAHLALGDLPAAEKEFAEVIERAWLIDKRTLLGVLDWHALLRFFQSEYLNAEKLFRETLDLSSELGDAFRNLKSHYFLCLTLANLGRISEAFEILSRAVDMARRNGDVYWSARVPNCFGWIHRELEDIEGAVAFDRDGADTARRLAVVEAEVNSVINLGFDYFRAGDDKSGCLAMKSAESLLSQAPLLRWRFEIRFQAARAEQTLSKPDALCLLEKATKYGARKYIVAGRTMLAKIAMAEGDLVTGEAELNAALTILREFPAPLVAWKTWSMLGRVYTGLQKAGAARAAYREAASVVREIAGNVSDGRLREIFLGSAAVQEVLAFAA